MGTKYKPAADGQCEKIYALTGMAEVDQKLIAPDPSTCDA